MSVLNRLNLPYSRTHVPADLSTVTDIDPREITATDAGLAPRADDRIWQRAEALYQTGMDPGIALCVRYRGHTILNRTIGYARGNGPNEAPGTKQIPMTIHTPVCLFSASKAVTAMLVHWLAQKGKINLLDPVAHYLPEFANNGKENVTIQHLLSHRGGVPRIEGNPDVSLLFEHEKVIDMLCHARPISISGRRQAYHAITAGFILGEMIERVTGKTLNTLLDEVIRQPLGMQYFRYGLPPEQATHAAYNYTTGLKPVFPLDRYIKHVLGGPMEAAVDISNDPRWFNTTIPAGNLYATAEEASRFFELLRQRGSLNGVTVFDPMTVHRAVMEAGKGPEIDGTLMFPMRFSMGMMLGSNPVGLFGPSSEQAYGHLGFVSVLCWADPEREISVALLTTGKTLVGPSMPRWFQLIWEIARQCPQTRFRK